MVLYRASLGFLLSAALAVSPAVASTVQRTRPSSHAHGSHKATSRKASSSRHKLHGQQSIEPARAREIQQALIREHYLNGEATGNWDPATEAAMQKYQADQGWQTKLMPDSRALKKLGLGPDYSGAINAKDASFTDPPPTSTITPEQSANFASASGINR